MTTEADCNVQLIFCHPDARMPTRAHYNDSGWDLYSVEETIIQPLQRHVIDTGLKISIQDGWEGQIRPRSGNAAKHGITVLNTPGTVDASYSGEVRVILYNTNSMPVTIRAGDRIAQIVFQKIPTVSFSLVTEFSKKTDRGEGGFGSTGTIGSGRR